MGKVVKLVSVGCGILFGSVVIVGSMWAIVIAATVILDSTPTPQEQLIQECEKSLPRSKTCKLVAVESE